ncbi:MAG: hypothetical protein GYB65_21655 [Chloroflexi bacterium]|nr:hypothetical protein [Chloroflexota bacterium]
MRNKRRHITSTLAMIMLLLIVSLLFASYTPPVYSGYGPAQDGSPTPEPGSTLETEDLYPFLAIDVPAGNWRTQPFIDVNGDTHTLEDFTGRVVVVQLVSISCAPCIEQQQNLLGSIQIRTTTQRFAPEGANQATEEALATQAVIEANNDPEFVYVYSDQIGDTVYVTLGIKPTELPEHLMAVYERELGEEAWEHIDYLQRGDIPADWLLGVASPDFTRELLDTFNRYYVPSDQSAPLLAPEMLPIILIEPDGTGHLLVRGSSGSMETWGLVSPSELFELVTFLSASDA